MPTDLKSISQNQLRMKLYLSSALSAVILIIGLIIFEMFIYDIGQQKAIKEVTKQGAELRSDLEAIINKNLSLTKGLATYISLNPDLDQGQFSTFTSQLLSDSNQIRSIGAARDLIVTHIYPFEGNQAALGLNYRENNEQRKAALQAMTLNKTIIAGPLSLVQGGTGLIARTPILIKGSGAHWGLLSVVLDHQDIFSLSGLIGQTALDIALQGKDAAGIDGDFFFGKPDIINSEPVRLPIKLPHGEWVLYATPKGGWKTISLHYMVWAVAGLVLVLWLFLLFHRYRTEVLEVDSLQAMLDTERKFRKIFHNHNAMMLLINNRTGQILDVNRSALSFYGYDYHQLTSMSIFEVNALTIDEIKQEMRNAAELHKNYFIFPHRLANGTIRFVEVHSTPIDLDGETLLFSILHDITERIEIEQKLKLDAKVFEHSQEGVLMTDAKGRIISVNNAFSDITGYALHDVLGENPSILRSGKHSEQFYKNMYIEIAENGFWKGEIWNRKKDGTVYPQLLSISKVENDAHELTHYVAVFSDITRLKQSEARMKKLAHYDALTDLPNRLLLTSRLEHASEKMKRHPDNKMALLFLDLDHFKIINDSLGHSAGDELLKLVSQRLRTQLRAEDTVARLGGDEFAILLEQVNDINDLATVAQNIIESVKRPYILESGQEAVIGTSIGIAIHPDDSDNIDKLLTYSDAAMYRAKNAGRNTFAFYTQSITSEAELKMRRINELRRAVENEEFELYYQPQVDLDSLKIVGAEALIRWNHPTEGVLSPFHFIDIAEETGIIHEISKWVIASGCAQLKRWQAQRCDMTLSLNVSPKDFRYDDLHFIVETQLRQHDVRPNKLELELTENGLMETNGNVMDLLHQLRNAGVSLAVDDFGTGHSSIAYLKHFPVNKLKIDQSFVRDITNDASDRMITETIVDMARNFNLKVVAEGIETEQQQEVLKSLGCHIAQGYLYSRPIPLKQFEKLLSATHFPLTTE